MFKSKWMNFLLCVVILYVTWYSYDVKYDTLNAELKTTQTNLQTEVNKSNQLKQDLNAANEIIEDLKDSEYELVYMGKFKTTYYCNAEYEHICGIGERITASGKPTEVGKTVAVDKKIIPLGSEVYIAGIGWRSADDTGGAIKGNRIDILVDSHDEAMNLGVTNNDVWVLIKKL